MKNFSEMIRCLQEQTEVIGLIRYGGRRTSDMSVGGDFDLFVILNEACENVESLHFYIEDIPVDLNIRTLPLENLEWIGFGVPMPAYGVELHDADFYPILKSFQFWHVLVFLPKRIPIT